MMIPPNYLPKLISRYSKHFRSYNYFTDHGICTSYFCIFSKEYCYKSEFIYSDTLEQSEEKKAEIFLLIFSSRHISLFYNLTICLFIILAKIPFSAFNFSGVPVSATLPSSRTTILSALATVRIR